MAAAPRHSLLAFRKNDAFIHIVGGEIFIQMGERSYYISTREGKSMMADCRTEREAALSMHNILLFNEVDTIYFMNKSSIDAATEMHALYARNDMPTWFWGISMPGSMLFECRGITISYDVMRDFSMRCHHYEPPIKMTDTDSSNPNTAMSNLEAFQCYVKYTPLTFSA